ncbi:S8 family serine peptidase [Methermicoccus shengliensis]|uniref:S8 family serine peptidase n=1 Tax=Methermicoccus shengliensis TaxID=660064 RepID=A0A832RVH1_9EURY|nr:S8 family serine peptidase [Methermicoccus shengliensis]MDI3488097.1 minor extracellular serine protease Vpr [Methanosarcinales archaeon]MDN5295704.1 minor extracellular serine protease Vpr [Methanosarcinales archaeon]HIH70162.1 S8 family serine peptidase [Methermicoccus shengliensis]
MQWVRVVGALVLMVAVFALSGAGASGADGKISQAVLEQYSTSESARVIVLFERGETTPVLTPMAHMLQQQREGIRDVRELWLINGVAMNATRDAIERMARDPSVLRIVPDYPVYLNDIVMGVQKSTPEEQSVSEGVLAVNATPVWLNGYTGRGVNVSIVDTGIARHPDVADRLALWKDFVNGQSDFYDDYGHGTHVAGIVAGNGTSGTITGVAPNATLFGAKVFGADGSGNVSSVIAAFQWSVEHGADIISYSGGTNTWEQYTGSGTTDVGTSYHSHSFSATKYEDAFKLAFIVAKCQFYDTDVCSATDAYNGTTISLIAPNGSEVSAYPVDWVDHPTARVIKYMADSPLPAGEWKLAINSTVSGAPYTYELVGYYESDGTSLVDMAVKNATEHGVAVVVAAGNAGEGGLRTISAPGTSRYAITVGATHASKDYIAPFSSRGPVNFTSPYIKPDVCAPGVDILSLDKDGGYVRMSGTSMATPFVSGIVALMLDANGTLSPQQIKDILATSAVDLGVEGKDNTYGWGRVDAWRAVNAVAPLAPAVNFTSAQLQLFGGALTDDIVIQPPVLDSAGDGGAGDVLAAGLDIIPSTPSADFFILTKDIPDPSVCEYRIYVDTDASSSTGFSMHGIGVDAWVVLNSTSSVLLDANNTTLSSAVPWAVEEDTLWIRPSRVQLGITNVSSPLRFVVETSCGGDVDVAPDVGYGAYPYHLRADGFAVVWDTAGRQPAPNESVRFELYGWNTSTHGYDTPMGSVNTTTNATGYARASFEWLSTSTRGDGLLRISTGDILVEDTFVWYPSLPSPQMPFVPTLTPTYLVNKDGILNVSYTLVRPDFTPYDDPVTLVFGTPEVNYTYMQVNLTPVRGTVSYSLDLSTTSLDENASFGIYLLNGTVEHHDYCVWAGVAVVADDMRTLSVQPSFAPASPLSNTTFLVLTGGLYDGAPLSRNVSVDVYWLTESEVKELSAEVPYLQSGVSRLYLEGTGVDWLSDAHLHAVLRERASNLKHPSEHTTLSTNSHGVGILNITPPIGAYFGLVVVSDGGLERGAGILVRDPHLYDRLITSPTLPIIESTIEWYARYNGSAWNAEPHLRVNVSMYYLNESTQMKKTPLAGETLHLVLSTGEARDVLTDGEGRASAVFDAPILTDIANTTPIELTDYVGLSPWSVGVVVISDRADEKGGMLATHAYGTVQVPLSQRHAVPHVHYESGRLLATTTWWDEEGALTSAVPTVLDVVRRAPATGQVVEVLLSKYIDDGGTYHTESVDVGAFGEYVAYASTLRNMLHGSTIITREDEVAVMPMLMTDLASTYPPNITVPVRVRVTYLNGTPIPDALVYLWASAGAFQTDPRHDSYVVNPPAWSTLDYNYTDAQGATTLQMRTPPHHPQGGVRVVIGLSTGEQIFETAREYEVYITDKKPALPIVQLNHTINNALSPSYFNASPSHDPDGTIVHYMWDFGDGTSGSGVLVDHTYTSYLWNGTQYMPFEARLTVLDDADLPNSTTVPVIVYMAGDANGDGVSNILDAALVGLHWMASYGTANYHDGADLNNDNVVDILDAAIVGLNWNRRAGSV